MSVIVDIADAVVSELNGATLSQSFTAERAYLPKADLKDLADLHVTVVPKAMTVNTSNRTRTQHDVALDVAVQQKVAAGDNTAMDGLMSLAEEIADAVRFKRVAGAMWIKNEHEPIYAAEHLEQMQVLTSVITVTYRLVR